MLVGQWGEDTMIEGTQKAPTLTIEKILSCPVCLYCVTRELATREAAPPPTSGRAELLLFNTQRAHSPDPQAQEPRYHYGRRRLDGGVTDTTCKQTVSTRRTDKSMSWSMCLARGLA